MRTNGKDPRWPWNAEPKFRYVANALEPRPTREAGQQEGPKKVQGDKIDTSTIGR
jgi:hypothetical protein